MPEGPELYLASRFVNKVAREYLFTGCVKKSAVSTKNPDVLWNQKLYRISAQSRGKEVKLTLTEWNEPSDQNTKKKTLIKPTTLDILFRFGMSGKFSLSSHDDLPKHAHLNFFTAKNDMVLSFVDYRRFGRWEVNGDWSKDRGPCVLQEYSQFREHVLKSVNSPVFAKPICEVMLNQKYFNGIGNYLRAEILYRLSIPPFVSARSVLETLAPENLEQKVKVKTEDGDFLQLCNVLPLEVINLEPGKGSKKDIIPFVFQFDQPSTHFARLLMKEYQHLVPRMSKPLLQRPVIAFRRNKNLKDLLVKAKLSPVPDGKGYDPESGTGDMSEFRRWLRCYYNPDMTNMVDHNGRTIWFSGDPGPLKPQESKKRGFSKHKKTGVKKEEMDGTGESPIKKRKTAKSKIKNEDEETNNGHITREKLLKIEKSTPKRSRNTKTPVNDIKVSNEIKTLNSSIAGTPKLKTGVKLKTPKRSKLSKSKSSTESLRTTMGTRRSTRLQTKV